MTCTTGRDWLVDHAISGSRWQGKWWAADLEWRTDLLEAGNEGRSLSQTCFIQPHNLQVLIMVLHKMGVLLFSLFGAYNTFMTGFPHEIYLHCNLHNI